MIIDEILFYAGIVMVVIALISGIVCAFLFKIKGVRLEAQFDIEYGPKIQKQDELNFKIKIQ